MAYSSVRVQFEIGHEASVRNKRTPEGFTHDWEVFVRGADNTDIQCFVEKVVFHLHETFQKPRRVVKDPPYSVKECGYAGFVLPIDVYLKNTEEPKKINFQYDLQLQNGGPPISRVLREPRVFQNPSEDFRRKLIRGGGVGVDNPISDSKTSPKKSTQSPRKAEDPKSVPVKKHKPDLPLSNSFADLFGTPIRRVTPEPKKAAAISSKKIDNEKKKPVKESSIKEEKERTREKEKSKEKDKSKDKAKRPPSPPIVSKIREETREKDEKEKKKEDNKADKERREKHKEKDSEKVHKKDKKFKDGDGSKKTTLPANDKQSSVEPEVTKGKSDKDKHKHRHKKKEREKSREKDRHKHKEKSDKDRSNLSDKKRVDEPTEKIRKASPPPPKEKQKKGALCALLSELSDSTSLLSDDDDEFLPSSKSVPDPPRIQPEPKAKPVAEVKPLISDKKEKVTKIDEAVPNKMRREKSPKKRTSKTHSEHDVKRAKIETKERRRSFSDESDEEPEIFRNKKMDAEKEVDAGDRNLKVKDDNSHKKRNSEVNEPHSKGKSQRKDKESKKRSKEKSDVTIEEVKDSTRYPSRSPSLVDETPKQARRTPPEIEPSSYGRPSTPDNDVENFVRPTSPESETTRDTRPSQPVEFTKEYLSQLRELQRRIMMIEDNAELQKVVKVIAESGQYEVTKKTFDFDLCTLDYGTVRRLQEFFT